MKKYGLIGYPLSHSFSPSYFKEKYDKEGITDAEYKAYPMEDVAELRAMMDCENIVGLNVTIPHKESVIPLLDEVSEEAREVGAVNTIHHVDGKLVGYNTDVIGFRDSLKNFIEGACVDHALVLGSGGAAKAVAYVLKTLNIDYKIVSRSRGDIRYGDIGEDTIRDHQLIINTTPLGMYPNIEKCPDIPYSRLTDKHFLYDLVYNPEKTLFLKNGEQNGAAICNGLEMLYGQAEASWAIWNQI